MDDLMCDELDNLYRSFLMDLQDQIQRLLGVLGDWTYR